MTLIDSREAATHPVREVSDRNRISLPQSMLVSVEAGFSASEVERAARRKVAGKPNPTAEHLDQAVISTRNGVRQRTAASLVAPQGQLFVITLAEPDVLVREDAAPGCLNRIPDQKTARLHYAVGMAAGLRVVGDTFRFSPNLGPLDQETRTYLPLIKPGSDGVVPTGLEVGLTQSRLEDVELISHEDAARVAASAGQLAVPAEALLYYITL